jgi:hypothetical protein
MVWEPQPNPGDGGGGDGGYRICAACLVAAALAGARQLPKPKHTLCWCLRIIAAAAAGLGGLTLPMERHAWRSAGAQLMDGVQEDTLLCAVHQLCSSIAHVSH